MKRWCALAILVAVAGDVMPVRGQAMSVSMGVAPRVFALHLTDLPHGAILANTDTLGPHWLTLTYALPKSPVYYQNTVSIYPVGGTDFLGRGCSPVYAPWHPSGLTGQWCGMIVSNTQDLRTSYVLILKQANVTIKLSGTGPDRRVNPGQVAAYGRLLQARLTRYLATH